MWTAPVDHPLRRLFAGLAEDAFLTTLGIADPPLIDYVSELLTRFVHFDAVNRLRDPHGRPLTEVRRSFGIDPRGALAMVPSIG